MKNNESGKEQKRSQAKRYYERLQRDPKGLLRFIYNSQLSSSRMRGHCPPNYTLQELVEKYGESPEYLRLYHEWIESGMDKWLKPSFDRIDNSKGYSFDNIELTTWRENLRRKPIQSLNSGLIKKGTPVSVYKNYQLVGEFKSLADARRKLGVPLHSHGETIINTNHITKDGYQVFSENYTRRTNKKRKCS